MSLSGGSVIAYVDAMRYSMGVTKGARPQHLALALPVFYLLYTLTSLYGETLYQLNSSHIYNLAWADWLLALSPR